MTSTYDFISDIDEIEKMNIDAQVSENSSILDVTLHNLSLDMTSNDIKNQNSTNKKSHQNENRILDIKRI